MENLESIGPLSKKVMDVLKRDGWRPGRDEAGIEQEFIRILGDDWLPVAAPFLRVLGGLAIDHAVCVWSEPESDDFPLVRVKDRIAGILGVKVMAVALSGYMGDGCVLWVDELGRYYVADSEGLLFIGKNAAEALEVLLGGAKPAPPPPEIADQVFAAYEWSQSE